MSPTFECKHHRCKLKIMSWIVHLMWFQLSRPVSYNLPVLHKHTSKSILGCITIYCLIFASLWYCENRCCCQLLLDLLETFLTLSCPDKWCILPQQHCHWSC